MKTPRGKDVLTYLVFVVVAFVFWLMLSLDSTIQRDYDLPVEIENVPDSVTFISTPPPTINVSVRAKGAMLVRYNWGRIRPIRFNFHEFIDDDNSWGLNSMKLAAKVRDYFGDGTNINSIRPDSLRLIYTTLSGEKIPLKVDIDATTNMQSVICGPITANVDSVMAYSPNTRTRIPAYAETEAVRRRNLHDTTYIDVKLKSVRGVRFIPSKVRIRIPVEPLISKRQEVRVKPVNLPPKHDMITFPSKVEVAYLLPMSRYNEDLELNAVVDYDKISKKSHKVPVRLSTLPQYVKSVSITPDSVEYVIESND